MFDYILVAIEEFRDFEKLKIEELQSYLEAYEMRMWERNPIKLDEQALKEEQNKGQEKEAYIAQEESDSELLILITTTYTVSSNSQDKLWYLDSGCSNHMTCHKEWLVNFDETKKSMVKFADNNTSKVEGVGDVIIRRKNDSRAILACVLFVPAIRYNLLSIGQLIQNGFIVAMGGFNKVEVFDKRKNLILRSKISKNKTF
ncbi:uncharacterized protein LOC106763361 [Vigna radiata var. radiata]|uniref:Uncharacterized protein LOC106763361 n=1 Tax=Vigna radiata var. radiata TaxID=3916 RepID=A0A1S3UAK1_VIGRR|nr:uncharacterized protein LOC106763361 [Vigna radiata var. radiata]